MAAKFVAEEGELRGLALSLNDGEEWVIGRDPDACQLVIEDPATSRRHLICRTSPEGFIIENLSEINPVEINDEKVHEPRLLKNGDSVKIGSTIFRFYTDGDKQVTERDVIEAEPETETFEQQEERTDLDETPGRESIYDEASAEDKGILAEINFDLRETGRWLLKVVGGPNNGAEFSMHAEHTYTMGTDPTVCDIVFHDTSISRQHARLTVTEDERLVLEDLNSRNGTHIESKPVEGKASFEPNTIITMGTTSIIVFDREGDMQTIISPLLPSIVKVLQKQDEKRQQEEKEQEEALAKAAQKPVEEQKQKTFGAIILIATLALLLTLIGGGTLTLFQAEPVQEKKEINYFAELDNALSQFPSVRYNYTPTTGKLLLVGHVLSPSEKNQLLYNLQSLEFLRDIDHTGLIVDEYVWREINSILNRDSRWRGISIHSPTAGTFVLSGYLQTRKQAEELSDYITAHFPYLDLLERRVIVEEDVISSVEIELQKAGVRDLDLQMNNGELTISGGLAREQIVTLDRLTRSFREIPGVRNVKTFIREIEPEKKMVNITDRYPVTGSSNLGGGNISVVINGRILTRGDVIDGMTITSIRPTVVSLERGGIKYRIDYNRN